jgi:hypothetical protein
MGVQPVRYRKRIGALLDRLTKKFIRPGQRSSVNMHVLTCAVKIPGIRDIDDLSILYVRPFAGFVSDWECPLRMVPMEVTFSRKLNLT